MKISKNKTILYALLCVGIILTSCGGGKPKDKNAALDELKKQREVIDSQIANLEKELNLTAESGMKVIDVAVTEVKPGQFDHYIEIQGKLDGEENVGIYPQSPGIVTQIYAQEGDVVKKGQVLAQLDNKIIVAQVDALKTQLELAENLYQKQKNLWDQKIGSEVQFLQAKTSMEALERNIQTLNEQLEMAKIKSPINGTVQEVNIKVGQMAAAGAIPLFRVTNFSTVKVLADVSETYGPKVHSGDQVIVYFPDYQTEFPSKIRFASRYINPTNRTFQIEMRLGPSKIDYRANMMAVVKINDYSNKSAFSLPFNVVREGADGKYVYVVKEVDGKTIAQRQIVTIGQTYNGLAEITSGLKTGDKVVTLGMNALVENQPVLVK